MPVSPWSSTVAWPSRIRSMRSRISSMRRLCVMMPWNPARARELTGEGGRFSLASRLELASPEPPTRPP